MAAKDALGNIQSAVCSVKVDFVTDDRTVVMPEEIKVDQGELVFDLILTKRDRDITRRSYGRARMHRRLRQS